ncbi:MAG: hypothetical protein M1816_001514 [Peltula sp. TS41687]|nr:MAG: hypothetical protein M1816_001514 [Peltula sp. TS41687]
MAWEARLEEDPVYTDGDPSKAQTLVFHGHSRAGNVTGPLVYANYGSREDFESLQQRGVNLTGAIALVKYYGTQGDRALKVKAAELAGAVGCLIYSDPNEDGFKKGEVWPEGRWRPKDSVQRGAVSLMSWIVGDVLTPGFASTPDAARISKDKNPGLVNIPSLPLAWRDAQPLLQSLKGHGIQVDQDWIGGVPDIGEWWSGNQSSPIIHLMNEQDEEEKQPIWNVLGRISGSEQPEKSVIVGNHRDAWCFGAADPGSGTAVMLEVVHIFSELRRLGWQPLRTIQFASWDGEEYNLIGSTEWVEDNVEDLRRNGIGYINLDMAVSGTEFKASASPLFKQALLRVLDRTVDPATNHTLRSIWDQSRSKLKGLGAGSDFVAFQDIAGTSSIDLGFEGPGFEYHSCYDTFEWMENFGDPGFQYHKVMAQVMALLILELADRPILPYDLITYASAVRGYISDLEEYASKKAKNNPDAKLNLDRLRETATQFMHDAHEFHNFENIWTEKVSPLGGVETAVMAVLRISHNERMADFETHLLDLSEGGGVPGREQFKHMLFAPQAWSGYDEAYFPGVRDALDEGNWTLAQQQADKVAEILGNASYTLGHG